MKERIYIFIASVFFLTATGFAFQDQADTSKTKNDAPATSKAEEILLRELDATKKELATMKKETEADKRKRDSVDAERAVNLSISQGAANDLRMSNKALRTVAARLSFIVSKMNPDSAMKYYGEFDELNPRDSLKKNLSPPKIDPNAAMPRKRSWFYRVFHK